MNPRSASLSRRGALGALLTLGAAACTSPAESGAVSPHDVYVGLGRAREVVVLDSATDRERRRVSLAPLGERSVPWRIGVGPTGSAAVMPAFAGANPSVGVIASPADTDTPDPAAANTSNSKSPLSSLTRAQRPTDHRCVSVGVGLRRSDDQRRHVISMSQILAADGRGRAYAEVGDGFLEPSYAAVVDLQRSATLRHLPLAQSGESVLSLAVNSEGDRLYAGIWFWGDATTSGGIANSTLGTVLGRGRFVALDTTTGQITTRSSLPAEAAVTDATIASPPPGSETGAARVLYAVIANPGPARLDDDFYGARREYFLAMLDLNRLETIAIWPLTERPTSLAVTPDGTRAYLLNASPGWNSSLTCLDLTQGAATHSWPLPGACMGMALSATGRLYVADPFGDRLWRLDTRTNLPLPTLSLPGAPLALATS